MIVRINQYPEDHINAYARVEKIDYQAHTVRVANMNMPFQGTFSYQPFTFDEVTFVDEVSEDEGTI